MNNRYEMDILVAQLAIGFTVLLGAVKLFIMFG